MAWISFFLSNFGVVVTRTRPKKGPSVFIVHDRPSIIHHLLIYKRPQWTPFYCGNDTGVVLSLMQETTIYMFIIGCGQFLWSVVCAVSPLRLHRMHCNSIIDRLIVILLNITNNNIIIILFWPNPGQNRNSTNYWLKSIKRFCLWPPREKNAIEYISIMRSDLLIH